MGPYRQPAEESDRLYPQLSLHDERVSGSIVVDHSRLPLWAFVGVALEHGWEEAEANFKPTATYGFTAEDCAAFIGNLLELRGEFGRLLLVLADVERREAKRNTGRAWWERPRVRARVITQLRRCLAALGGEGSHG